MISMEYQKIKEEEKKENLNSDLRLAETDKP